jgi:hypothetical protein
LSRLERPGILRLLAIPVPFRLRIKNMSDIAEKTHQSVELSNRAFKKPTVLVSKPLGRHSPKGERCLKRGRVEEMTNDEIPNDERNPKSE